MKLLTTPEVAHIVGRSAARIRQLVADGSLRAIKVGRDILVDEADLESFLAQPRRRPGRPKSSDNNGA